MAPIILQFIGVPGERFQMFVRHVTLAMEHREHTEKSPYTMQGVKNLYLEWSKSPTLVLWVGC